MQTPRVTNASLTQREVSQVKYRLKLGVTRRQLSKDYEVSLETISRIARGDTWWWVEADPGSYSIEEQADRQLGTNLVPRDDAGAQAFKESFMKRFVAEEAAKADVLPIPDSVLEKAKQFLGEDRWVVIDSLAGLNNVDDNDLPTGAEPQKETHDDDNS